MSSANVNRTRLSVVICAHNPHAFRLEQTLAGLRAQTMSKADWELILIDNASNLPLRQSVDLSWHPNGRIVVEEKLGLTAARLRGFSEAESNVVVMVDDDNVLDESYLERASLHFDGDRELGVAGGKSLPVYEQLPPRWLPDIGIRLACRDLGEERLQTSWRNIAPSEREYPSLSPVGAGMIVRREVWEEYRREVDCDPRRALLDRTGANLISGGDNDIVMTALEGGWDVAYLPDLSLKHLIPRERVQPEYLARLSEASYRSWVLVLDLHGLRPWKAVPRCLLPALKLRHYIRHRAWSGADSYIQWRGICGQLAGRALLR